MSRVRRITTVVLVVVLVLVGVVFAVGWSDDPMFGWVFGLMALAFMIVSLVSKLHLHVIVKAVVVFVVVMGGIFMATDPLLIVPKVRVTTHRADMQKSAETALASPTTGVFAGTSNPGDAVAHLAGTSDAAPVTAVKKLAGEKVSYGAVVVGPQPRVMFCLESKCELVLVFAPNGGAPTSQKCTDGHRVEVDTLVDDWYRMRTSTC